MNPFFNVLGLIVTNIKSDIDKGILGHGLTLKPLDIINNRNNYCQLYKNDKLVDKGIYRLGGISRGFKDKPYCNIIYYGTKHYCLKDASNIKHFGSHCIINSNGKIVLMPENSFSTDYPYYLQGCIAKYKSYYYNLITSNIITRGDSTVASKEYLFVENKFAAIYHEEDKYPLGVYKINWNTGMFVRFE